MKITIHKRFGNSTMSVEIDERDEKEALLKATFFLSAPETCGLCHSSDVVWDGRRARAEKGMFAYISRKCLKCGASSNVGDFREGGFFWKKWEVYRGAEDERR